MILILVVMVGGCKSLRYAAVDLQSSTVENIAVLEDNNEKITDNLIVAVEENEEVFITVFSVPDSVGRQFVMSVTEVRRQKRGSAVKDVEAIKTERRRERTEKTENRVEKSVKKNEIKTRSWLMVVILVLVILIVGWRWVKV